MTKDCRKCTHATLLDGKLKGWVSCDKIFGFDINHSPSFAENCRRFKFATCSDCYFYGRGCVTPSYIKACDVYKPSK